MLTPVPAVLVARFDVVRPKYRSSNAVLGVGTSRHASVARACSFVLRSMPNGVDVFFMEAHEVESALHPAFDRVQDLS